MDSLSKNLASYSSTYENYVVLGDFNVEVDNNAISSFCDAFDLVNLIREPTCYKNPGKPSCIDVIVTNKPISFQNSGVIETGLSDFHRMTVIITKMTSQELNPRIINYRDYKFFDNIRYRNDLLQEISSSYLEFNDNGFSGFFDICRTTLDQHAPRKKKYARGNHMPFINKTLSKEIMNNSFSSLIFPLCTHTRFQVRFYIKNFFVTLRVFIYLAHTLLNFATIARFTLPEFSVSVRFRTPTMKLPPLIYLHRFLSEKI